MIFVAIGCGGSGATSVGEQDNAVIGGVAATSARFDAVGAIRQTRPDGTVKVECTATLIAPRLILTARHCKVGFSNPEFLVGDDADHPRRAVKIEKELPAPIPADADNLNRGSDVSVAVLAEPIDDVEPIAVADAHVAASNLEKRAAVIGFGRRNFAGETRLRRLGSVTLRALDGSALQKTFGTEDALLSFVRATVGDTLRPIDVENLKSAFARTLRSGREVYVGQAPSDAQPCPGDSGGPLIGKVGGRLVVLGVTSHSLKIGEGFQCGVLGATYATLGADVQALVERAHTEHGVDLPGRVRAELDATSPVTLPASGSDCANITVSGLCDRNAVVRCVDASEGPRKLTHTDCALVNLTCATVGNAAVCVAP